MTQNMTTTSEIVVTNLEAALIAALRPAWPRAVVERTALEVARRVSFAALRAVAEAAEHVADAPRVARLEGFRSREDPDWSQLVLVVEDPGEPGSAKWHRSLDAAGRVIETAVERHPEAAEAITSQISFDL